MAPPTLKWELNVNTLLTLVGFVITIMGGAMAYASFRTETTAWRAETVAQIAELKAQRSADITHLEEQTSALTATVNTLMVQDARQSEQFSSALSALLRIERTIDRLSELHNGASTAAPPVHGGE